MEIEFVPESFSSIAHGRVKDSTHLGFPAVTQSGINGGVAGGGTNPSCTCCGNLTAFHSGSFEGLGPLANAAASGFGVRNITPPFALGTFSQSAIFDGLGYCSSCAYLVANSRGAVGDVG